MWGACILWKYAQNRELCGLRVAVSLPFTGLPGSQPIQVTWAFILPPVTFMTQSFFTSLIKSEHQERVPAPWGFFPNTVGKWILFYITVCLFLLELFLVFRNKEDDPWAPPPVKIRLISPLGSPVDDVKNKPRKATTVPTRGLGRSKKKLSSFPKQVLRRKML